MRDLKHYAEDHPNVLDPLNLKDLTLNLPSQNRVTYTTQDSKPVVTRNSADGRYKNGDPVFKYRFNLKKLDLFNQSSPDSNQLEKYFGLTKNSNGIYLYRGGSEALLTGAEIANKNREPDFFEYMAFGIKANSLGHYIGDAMRIIQVGTGLDDPKRHLMQIAANAIDQYDRDNNPTEILYNGQLVIGVESIPYFSGITYYYYIPLFQTLSLLMQPVLWNPALNANPSVITPMQSRVRTEGSFQLKSAQGPQSTVSYTSSSNAINLNSTESFSVKSQTTSFNSTAPSNYLNNGDTELPIGYRMANVSPVVVPHGLGYGVNLVHNTTALFALEYWTGSEWKKYQTINLVANLSAYTGIWPSINSSRGDIQKHLLDPRTIRFGLLEMWRTPSPYPQTSGKPAHLLNSSYNVFAASVTPSTPSFITPQNKEWGYLSINKTGTVNPYYSDPDGVVRPADFSRLDLTSNPLLTNTVGGASPIHLSSAFDSVATLGVVFRDLPFKSLNFTDSVSADFRLLDLFTVNEGDLVYGMIDVHYTEPNDLIYLLDQGKKSFYSTEDLWSVAESKVLTNQLQYTVGLYQDKIINHISDFSKLYASVLDKMIGSASQLKVKERSESILRLVTDHLQTDTYNFLLELNCQDQTSRKRMETYRISVNKKSAEVILIEKL